MRLIDADAMISNRSIQINIGAGDNICIDVADIAKAPTVDAVPTVCGHNVGDFCLYSFDNGNKSLAIVEIVKILNDERGVAEVKFHKVIVDDTGNDFFTYLHKTGQTMNASLCYLKNITPNGAQMNLEV